MKKAIALVAAVVLTTSSIFSQKIKGSDTVLPLTQKEVEVYMKANAGAQLIVTGGGSGVGISALIDGTTDIAMASRKIKLDEKLKVQDAGKTTIEKIIAYDALSVVVNPKNQISKLTRQQLEGIFTGKITNWKEVGGDDLKIVVYSRETSSGTYEFFKEHVLKGKNYMSSILSMPSTGAIIQSISQTPGAIGYVGFAYTNASVKDLEVSFDGKTFVTPSYENAKNKTYPIVRPLYFYYAKTDEAKVKSFIDFVLSPKGQEIVKTVGYIDVN